MSGSPGYRLRTTRGLMGLPYAIAYYDALGVLTSDAALTAAPDPFGRPQLWDRRLGGDGPVYRNGAWVQDGDPTSVSGSGVICYGPDINGLLNGSEGAYARVKHNRFGLFNILPVVGSFYLWRVDSDPASADGMYFKDDTGTTRWRVKRQTGLMRLGAWTVALLPAGSEGDRAYATNGRKVGEGPGSGTGVPVYYSAGAWRVYATDQAVTA